MRVGAALVMAVLAGLLGAMQEPPQPPARPDFDVRAARPVAGGSERALAEMARRRGEREPRARLHPHTGAIRVLDAPGWMVSSTAAAPDLGRVIVQFADRLGLDDEDVASLVPVRDYVSSSTGLRHVTFAQTLDGLPVFGAAITLHVAGDGTVVRATSSAARGNGRSLETAVTPEQAAIAAARDVSPGTAFEPRRISGSSGDRAARFARGPFQRDVSASLEWFAIDGGARLAWHVELEADPAKRSFDILIDAASGELLWRRNRVLDANGSGRVVQSDATQAIDPRQPDQMPGAGGCPPPLNLATRDLTAPFRDSTTVLGNTGRLSGNNVRVDRTAAGSEGALGSFDGTRWIFDYPFNSAASAETALFFAMNFAHDFFYDLGFDEGSGNFQADNFGRGGAGGDPVVALARAAGRNNATFLSAPEGSSPTISMFLFDGLGCWSEDVDGDGSLDIDGDYDTDVVIHEFHHGVSLRLNTTFTGAEAGAIGEGGGDFFAYSVNGDTTLAQFSRPGGLRAVNGKTYAAWECLLFVFCEVHDNGEIWANALWDVRERFRADLVRGSEAAAIDEAHQVYIDALKLSPPSPTMLDMRDAMLLVDGVRNPGSPRSQNFCALWESFAGRGMGLNATDTADNGYNEVGASFAVPTGCTAPPVPQTITIAATTATAREAGLVPGAFTVSRTDPASTPLTVTLGITGTAVVGADYQGLPFEVTIPADAAAVVVPVLPLDDPTVEVNETVIASLLPGTGYVIGSPAAATVTIVSDDAAPDFTLTALTVPAATGAGLTIDVTDTTRNQGGGAGGRSTTSFYLSVNTLLDASDELLGSRAVPELASGTESTATTPLVIPSDTAPGSYRLIAKTDGPGQLVESSETNNIRSNVLKVGPDLTITSLTVPPSAGAAVPFSVSYTAANPGGAAIAATTTRFYLSVNFSLDAGDRALQSAPLAGLDAGVTLQAGAMLTLPADTLGGLYYLFAVADGDNLIPEASDVNNQRYASIRVGPDLRVAALEVPVRASLGSTISVTDTTRNYGAGGSGPSRTVFYLSSDTSLDVEDFSLNVSRPVGPLEPNLSSAGTVTILLPPAATAGTWYVLADADGADEVQESNETNNLRYGAVGLGPDLNVAASTVPSTVVAGTSVVVSDTVRNSGADPAAPSTTRFHLSLNSALDASDIALTAQRAVPELATNAIHSGQTTIAIPSGLSGRYYLLIVADGNAAVAEAKENNNVRIVAITINP